MSTKMSHFLNANGHLPDDLRAQKLILFLGKIIRSVSSHRELMCQDTIQCRKYVAKKRCKGEIAAWCQDKNDQSPIEWFCLSCGHGGIIYDWQGTQFDQKLLRQERQLEHQRKGVWINGQRLDEVKIRLSGQTSFGGTKYLSYPGSQLVAKPCEEGILRLKIPALLAVELFMREIVSPQREEVTLKLGHQDQANYRFRGINYDASSGDVELEFVSICESTPTVVC